MEMTDEGILIRPVAGRQATAAPPLPGLEEEEPPVRRRGELRGLWARLGKR